MAERSPIGGGHLDLIKVIKDIQFGQADGVESIDTRRIAHHHQVQPATASFSPRGDTIFVAYALQLFTSSLAWRRGDER